MDGEQRTLRTGSMNVEDVMRVIRQKAKDLEMAEVMKEMGPLPRGLSNAQQRRR